MDGSADWPSSASVRVRRKALEKELRRENFARPQYSRALELIDEVAREASGFIEFGSGRGEFARLLREGGHNVVFTDVNEENVGWARENSFEAHVLDANEPMTLFEDGEFDGAVALEVIEHLTEAEGFLSEVHRILRPGGHLFLSTPNPYFLHRRLSLLAGHPISDEGYHFRFFSRRSLVRILREAGFNIVLEKPVTTAFGLNRIRAAFGLEPVWLPLPKGLHGLLARKFYLAATRT